MKKTVGIFVVVLVLVMLFTACQAAPEPAETQNQEEEAVAAETEDVTEEEVQPEEEPAGHELEDVGVSIMEMSWQYFVVVVEGMQEAADEAGLNLNIQDAKNDAATQMTQVETFVNQGVDAIVVDTIDAPALAPSAAKAKEEGICFEARLVEVPDATFTYLLDEYEYGVAIGTAGAEWANENYPDEELEIALVGMWDYKPSVTRFEGVKAAFLEGFPTGKIVTEQQANDPSSGMSAMEAIFQANPDIKMVLCDCDDPAVGVTEALKSLVPENDYEQYYVGGADAVDQAIQLIKEGSPMKSTVDLYNFEVGTTSVQLLLDWAAGEEVAEQVWMRFDAITYEDVINNY